MIYYDENEPNLIVPNGLGNLGGGLDKEEYYTKSQSDARFARKEDIPSLDGYATKEYVDEAIEEAIPSLDGYATEKWVEDQGYLKEHQSLEGYATEEWVEDQGYLKEVTAEEVSCTPYTSDRFDIEDVDQGIQQLAQAADFDAEQIAGKQDTLISGENIKTINGESILGEGDIEIGGGGDELFARSEINIDDIETGSVVAQNLTDAYFADYITKLITDSKKWSFTRINGTTPGREFLIADGSWSGIYKWVYYNEADDSIIIKTSTGQTGEQTVLVTIEWGAESGSYTISSRTWNYTFNGDTFTEECTSTMTISTKVVSIYNIYVNQNDLIQKRGGVHKVGEWSNTPYGSSGTAYIFHYRHIPSDWTNKLIIADFGYQSAADKRITAYVTSATTLNIYQTGSDTPTVITKDNGMTTFYSGTAESYVEWEGDKIMFATKYNTAVPVLDTLYSDSEYLFSLNSELEKKAYANDVTPNTSQRYFPLWNEQGVITGNNANAVGQAIFHLNGTYVRVMAENTSGWTDFFAPTTVGTNGQILVSNGSGAPVWKTLITSVQITADEYEALETKDPNTLYLIID